MRRKKGMALPVIGAIMAAAVGECWASQDDVSVEMKETQKDMNEILSKVNCTLCQGHFEFM